MIVCVCQEYIKEVLKISWSSLLPIISILIFIHEHTDFRKCVCVCTHFLCKQSQYMYTLTYSYMVKLHIQKSINHISTVPPTNKQKLRKKIE